MPSLSRTKKSVLAGSGALALLVTGGAAYAYWSTTASGSGSGTTEPGALPLALTASFPTTGLHPGGTVPVTFHASNTGNTDVMLGVIHGVVATNPSLCLSTDFSMADVIANQVIPANTANVLVTATGVLTFTNTSVNQDACKGATVTLTLTA